MIQGCDPGVTDTKPVVKIPSQHNLCSGSATEQLSALLKHFPGCYIKARKTSVLIRELQSSLLKCKAFHQESWEMNHGTLT